MKKNLIQFKFILVTAIVAISGLYLTSCYESNSEQAAPAPITDPGSGNPPGGGGTIPGVAVNGKIYYQQNCSLCHAAGTDDITSAFGAIDLAKQQSKISNDISQLDTIYNTMGRFNNIDQQRVDDLKKYLSGL